MQLQLTFLDLADPSTIQADPPRWEQIDQAARGVARELLVRLIARMLAGDETTEMDDE